MHSGVLLSSVVPGIWARVPEKRAGMQVMQVPMGWLCRGKGESGEVEKRVEGRAEGQVRGKEERRETQ